MKNLIFSFIKPSPDSIVASSRIALFLAEELKAPLTYKGDVSDEEVDTLFLVNGAFAFCKCLPELYKAVTTAKRIVWVQNDYTITPPKNTGDAQSPFRKAFVDRKLAGLPDIDYWTTIEPNATKTKGSAYINWNALTYDPDALQELTNPIKDVFYYGSFRENRTQMFRKYLSGKSTEVTVSSPRDKFREFFDLQKSLGVACEPKIQSEFFHRELVQHGIGIYIDDEKSQREFHSPANRFYEMLSAGLPMVFSEESVHMLAKAQIFVGEFVTTGKDSEYKRMLKNRADIRERQQELWGGQNYRQALKAELKRTAKRYGGVL